MKRFSILMGLSFAIIVMSLRPASASGFAIYFVNMQEVINQSVKGKQARSILESKVSTYREKIDKMRADIDKIKKELSSPILSQQSKTEKENKLQEKIADLQRFEQDARIDISNLERQYTQEIVMDVLKIIEKYRKEHKIPMIVEKNEAGILSADPKYDLTKTIIKLYDEQAK
jgi:outer membrane protein